MFTIIYVDDEPALLDVCKTFLEATAGFAVDTVTSAGEALTALPQKQYDAIVADYQMPEMDGISFLKAVRASGNTIPFILFTGRGREEVVIEAINNGADFYLQKGGDPRAQFAELGHKVRQAIMLKQVQKALHASEMRFRSLFELSAEPQMLMDAGSRVIDCNNAFLSLFEIPDRKIIIGHTPDEFSPPFQPDGAPSSMRGEEIMREAVRNGAARFEWAHQKHDPGHTPILCELWMTSITLDSQILFHVTVRDITERKRTEEELRAAYEQLTAAEKELKEQYRELVRSEQESRDSQERFRTLADAALEGIMIHDRGIIVVCNSQFAAMFGYQPGEIIGRNGFEFMMTAESRDAIFRSVQAGAAGPIRITGIKKDGTTFFGETTAAPILWHGREHISVHMRDVTERKRAMDALRESEEMYRLLSETSPDMVYFVDPGGFVRFVNSHASEAFHAAPGDLTGKHLTALFPPEIAIHHLDGIRRVVTTRQPVSHEISENLPSGRLWIEVRLTPVIGLQGTVSGVLGISRDITSRKQAEEALRESELLMREVFDNANDAVYLLERTSEGPGRYILVNDKAVEMLGYAKDELLQMSPRDLVPEDVQVKVMPGVMQKLETEGHATFESAHRRKDGTVFPIEVSTHTFRYKGKDVDLSICRDITGRREAEKALRESEELHRKLVTTVPDIVIQTDLQGKILYANERVLEIGRYSSDREILDTSVFDLVAPEELPRARESAQRMFEGPQGPVEYTIITRDKTRLALEINGDILRDTYGTPYGMVFVARDVTQRKRSEEAIRSAHRQLTLLSSITRHDVMNKVAVMQGYLALAARETDRRKLQEFIQNTGSAAEDIAAQLEFSRIYGSLGTEEPRWHELATLLGSLRVPDSLQIEKYTDRFEVYADTMIGKVFENLLDNSVRHGEHVNRIRVSAREESGSLVLAWEDDGAGIPADEKEQVFEREYGKHTGMGLFLIREILGITGITIRETGEQGKGARFEMIVPEGKFRRG